MKNTWIVGTVLVWVVEVVLNAGHKILNTVDCTRPNGGRLPEKVDLMMSDFAGGASGFPMTFYGGKYTGKPSTKIKCFFSLDNKVSK